MSSLMQTPCANLIERDPPECAMSRKVPEDCHRACAYYSPDSRTASAPAARSGPASWATTVPCRPSTQVSGPSTTSGVTSRSNSHDPASIQDRDFVARSARPARHRRAADPGCRAADAADDRAAGIRARAPRPSHRERQPGPARGWWQFERAGGVAGVMRHPASAALARNLCQACHVPFSAPHIWRCLEGHDVLAAGFARLLLWTDPTPLPTDHAGGWDYYLNNWRPGKPHPAKWPGYWRQAGEALA